MLRGSGLTLDARPYPDHHRYGLADIARWPAGPVLMTEKDAVKVRRLPPAGRLRPDLWYVPVMAVPAPGFVADLDRLLARRGILPTQPAGAGG